MTAPSPLATKPKNPAPAQEPAAPSSEWRIEVVDDRSSLVQHQPAWDLLAANAIEPNVFYEPWMFVPAATHFEPEKPLRCVFVYRRSELCGFFPFERRRRFRGLPVRTLRLFEPAFVLFTPLIHRDWAPDTLRQVFDWAEREERCSLLEMPTIHGEGPFHQALVDVLRERRMLTFVDEVATRAMIRRGKDAESYGVLAHDKETRRNWKRLRRRLAEQGKLESRVLQPHDDAGRWIEQFLQLESAGWKGKEQTALAATEASAAIFREAGRNAHAVGKLQMLGLFLNDQPIALKCNYLSGPGGYTYKITYDEAFAKFSPGVLLELDNIEEMHRRPEVQWLDSCAVPDHFMMNRLWKERRTIQSLVLSTSRFVGNGIVGLLPWLRSLKRMIKR